MRAFGTGSPAGLCDVMSRFYGRAFACPFKFCPVMKENSHSQSLCPDILRHSIDSSGHSLRSSLPESSLLPVRLAYQQCFCGHCVPFLAELPRFENSQNVKCRLLTRLSWTWSLEISHSS